MGVVKALMDTKTLPQVITGTSAGSLIAAVICVRTDEEIYSEVLTVDFHKRCTACEAPLSVIDHFTIIYFSRNDGRISKDQDHYLITKNGMKKQLSSLKVQ